jgi:hypothetical protein
MKGPFGSLMRSMFLGVSPPVMYSPAIPSTSTGEQHVTVTQTDRQTQTHTHTRGIHSSQLHHTYLPGAATSRQPLPPPSHRPATHTHHTTPTKYSHKQQGEQNSHAAAVNRARGEIAYRCEYVHRHATQIVAGVCGNDFSLQVSSSLDLQW